MIITINIMIIMPYWRSTGTYIRVANPPGRGVSENMSFGFLLRYLLRYSVFYYAIYYATRGTSE